VSCCRGKQVLFFSGVDACLIRLADQFGTGDILTLDQDFAIYRWGKNKSFRMLPSADFLG